MTRELGPRVTVAVGKGKGGKAIYSYMLKKHADYFKFPGIQKKLVTRNGPKRKNVAIRGALGQNHIKVPIEGKTTKGSQRYYQMPMPPQMTIAKIAAFLNTAKRHKPESFVTQDGRTYPVNQK